VCSLIRMVGMVSLFDLNNDGCVLRRLDMSLSRYCYICGKLISILYMHSSSRRRRRLIGKLRRESELECFTNASRQQQQRFASPSIEIYRLTIQCCALPDSSRRPCAVRRSFSTACNPHINPRTRPNPRHLRATHM
jgi:hypothetical protein